MDVLIKKSLWSTQLCSFHIRRQHISYTDYNWSCESWRIYPSFKKTKELHVFGVCVSFLWIIFLLTTILPSYVLVPPRKAFEMLWIKYLREAAQVILLPNNNVVTIALSRKLLMLTAPYELWELYTVLFTLQVLKPHMHPTEDKHPHNPLLFLLLSWVTCLCL